MKKTIVSLVAAFMLVGCAAEKPAEQTSAPEPQKVAEEQNKTAQAEPSYDGFVYTAKGVDIKLGARADEIIKALGEPTEYFEAASCAFEGLDKTYYYNGFEVYTYPQGSDDYILSVALVDDSSQTPEGISIGTPLAAVKEMYGDDVKDDMGLYTYKKGKTSLQFLIENDVVSSITYLFDTN